jgi:autotransporter passenger strand-loop-strand repeat protein
MGVIVSAGNSPHNVLSGHAESGDTVVSGGTMFVLSGGTADATTISSGGILVVDKGGLGKWKGMANPNPNLLHFERGDVT